jgi:alpha-amylase
MQRELTCQLFGQNPRVLLSTECAYSNALARGIERIGGFDAIVIDAVDVDSAERRCGYLHIPPHAGRVKLLLKNRRLSNDLTSLLAGEKPAMRPDGIPWINTHHGRGAVETICIDFEALELSGRDVTRAVECLGFASGQVLEHPCGQFRTPGDVARSYDALHVLDVPETASATGGQQEAVPPNALQQDAAAELYQLEPAIRAAGDPELLASWRRLQCRHHLARMDTGRLERVDLHAPASADESPYDAYINFMNVLANLKARCAPFADAYERVCRGEPSTALPR